jgi:hypothetical protein
MADGSWQMKTAMLCHLLSAVCHLTTHFVPPWAPMHGFEISAWIEEHSGAAFDVDAPGIYQSLYRMEARGLVDAEWGISEKQRRARYYKLTARGRAQLRQETETWRRYAAGVTQASRPSSTPPRVRPNVCRRHARGPSGALRDQSRDAALLTGDDGSTARYFAPRPPTRCARSTPAHSPQWW